jgi:hypothetical protein
MTSLRNMYGCLPCPKCGSPYRCPYEKSKMIECDDCGYKVLWEKNGDNFNGKGEVPVSEEAVYYYRYDGYKNARCESYRVMKKTLRGVWIYLGYQDKKFILNHARRRWAYPDKEDALNSFKIRKERQIMHSNDSIEKANQALLAVGLKTIDPQTRFRNYDDDREFW